MSENYNPFQNAEDRDTEIKIPEFLRPHSSVLKPLNQNKKLNEPNPIALGESGGGRGFNYGKPENKNDLFSKKGQAKSFFPVPEVEKPKLGGLGTPNIDNADNISDLLDTLELVFGEYRVQVYCLCLAYKHLIRFKGDKKIKTLETAEWYVDKYISYNRLQSEINGQECNRSDEEAELDEMAYRMQNFIKRTRMENENA